VCFAPDTIRDGCDSIATTFRFAATACIDAPDYRSLEAYLKAHPAGEKSAQIKSR
jgi:hypothetical protein